MEGSEQLALPLFEPEASDDEPKPRQPSHRVASIRIVPQSSETSDAPPLLTTREAADLLHVHPRTVQRLVERGELSSVHLGAAVRFDPADVVDLTGRLKRHTEQVRPPAETVRRGHAPRRSFADRLGSTQHEHRADPA
jgi:excisionase family DNA binding protein